MKTYTVNRITNPIRFLHLSDAGLSVAFSWSKLVIANYYYRADNLDSLTHFIFNHCDSDTKIVNHSPAVTNH